MSGVSRATVALGTALLLLAAGCSAEPEPTDPPPPTSDVVTPTATSSPASTSAAPSPSLMTTRAKPTQPIESTVAPRREESKPPVKLDQPSTTGTGLTAKPISVKAMEARAQLPGEIAGPALAITIEVSNTGTRSADLGAVVVNLLGSDEAPGAEMTAAPAQPLTGRFAPRKTARGVYVFRVPEDKRRPVTVTVSIGDAPVLVFTGTA